MEYSANFYLIFIVSLIFSGAIAGLIAGLLGIGGGLVLVPVLYYLFTQLGVSPEICMHVSVGTSLASIIFTSLSSTHAHYKQGSVDMTLIKRWAPWLIIGAVVAMIFFGALKSLGLTIFFAVMSFAIAMYMLFSSVKKKQDDTVGNLPRGPQSWISGLLVAGASSMMGIGGGSLTVPLLSYYHYPMRQAVGTSSAVGLLIAIPSAIGAALAGLGHPGLPPFSVGYVNFLAFIILIPLTSLFAPFGARLGDSINPTYLRYAFVLFLIFNAGTMSMKAV